MAGDNQYFNDHAETAFIEVVMKKGKLVDIKTGREVQLPERCRVRLVVPLYALDNRTATVHKIQRLEKILPKGEVLNFRFYVSNEMHKIYEFEVILLADLYLSQKGNKFSRLEPCRCLVKVRGKDDQLEADSLNQAYTLASVKYRSDNKFHSCNVFKTFYYQGKRLENLRSL